MTIPKHERDDPITIGNRLKSARALNGFTRTSFSAISGISANTLRAWEEPTTGRYGLTKKGVARAVEGFHKGGIYCTKEWLLLGEGVSPRVIRTTSASTHKNKKQKNWEEEACLLEDVQSFKTNNPDPIVAIVTDGSMLPLFSYGDYVGGNKQYGKDIHTLIGSNCIVETIENNIHIRKLSAISGKTYTLSALNQDPSISNPIMTQVKLKYAAEIVWSRWRERIKNISV